jgi:hypothetical protein
MRLSNERECTIEMVIEHTGEPPRLNNRAADSKYELRNYFIFFDCCTIANNSYICRSNKKI